MKFRVGDKVKCIRDSEHGSSKIKCLVLNKIYEIEAIDEFGQLFLKNVKLRWATYRFKLISNFKQKIKFIKEVIK